MSPYGAHGPRRPQHVDRAPSWYRWAPFDRVWGGGGGRWGVGLRGGWLWRGLGGKGGVEGGGGGREGEERGWGGVDVGFWGHTHTHTPAREDGIDSP